MLKISMTEFRKSFSSICNSVKRGKQSTLINNGETIGYLVPIAALEKMDIKKAENVPATKFRYEMTESLLMLQIKKADCLYITRNKRKIAAIVAPRFTPQEIPKPINVPSLWQPPIRRTA